MPLVVYRYELSEHGLPGPGWVQEGAHLSYPGRHPAVTANTATQLENGVPAASLLLEGLPDDARTLAALIVHEALHVFQASFPAWCWAANELDNLTYPAADPALLALQTLEDQALRQALPDGPDWRSWAARALAWRTRRFERLRPEHRDYERALERVEGLAHFLEVQFLGAAPVISPRSPGVRQRSYAVGAAWALLLDRVSADWQATFTEQAGALDELLAARLPEVSVGPLPEEVREQARAWAQEVRRERAQLEQDFEGQPGAVVVLSLPGNVTEMLTLKAFDPLNMVVLSEGCVLHRRFLRFGNGRVEGEVMGRPCLTRSAGALPLLGGIVELRVNGVQDARLHDAGRRLEAAGLTLTASAGEWVEEGSTWRYRA